MTEPMNSDGLEITHKNMGKVMFKRNEARIAKLEEENVRDSLTGAYNRKYFEKEATKLIDQKLPFAVLLFDIDDFKKFNDMYGHLSGDAALRHVVRVMSDSIKFAKATGTDDILARWGGEEIAILLRGVNNMDDALTVANRVRMGVFDSKVQTNDRKDLPITVSGGVAIFNPETDLEQEDIVFKADRALYIAKTTGKNKVEIDSENIKLPDNLANSNLMLEVV